MHNIKLYLNKCTMFVSYNIDTYFYIVTVVYTRFCLGLFLAHVRFVYFSIWMIPILHNTVLMYFIFFTNLFQQCPGDLLMDSVFLCYTIFL